MKDKIEQYKSEGITKTAAGSTIVTDALMHDIALELISDLQNTARILCVEGVIPQSVEQHFHSLSADIAQKDGSDGFKISIWFRDDLSRYSLLDMRNGAYTPTRTGGGIDNIIALFNTGYSAKSAVFGFWESAGINTWSRSSRPRLGFMESTIDEFNLRHANIGCHAELLW